MEADVREERLGDAVLLALKMEEEGMSQGMQVVVRSWKSQGSGCSSKTSRRDAALLHLDFRTLSSITVN